MPDVYIAEMVCDWAAMADKLGNTIMDWYNHTNGKRWTFSPEIDKWIKEFINCFE